MPDQCQLFFGITQKHCNTLCTVLVIQRNDQTVDAVF